MLQWSIIDGGAWSVAEGVELLLSEGGACVMFTSHLWQAGESRESEENSADDICGFINKALINIFIQQGEI